MAYSRELVRCPCCGARKVTQPSINGMSEMYCYCRGEATIMESLNDRMATLGATEYAVAVSSLYETYALTEKDVLSPEECIEPAEPEEMLDDDPMVEAKPRFGRPRRFFTRLMGRLPRLHSAN